MVDVTGDAARFGEGVFDLRPVSRLLRDHASPLAPRSCIVDGLRITVAENAFSPVLSKTSRFFGDGVGRALPLGRHPC